MNDFIASLPKKIDKFIEILIDYNGYVKVLQGLQNTLKIAVLGLIIGIVIGTLIATVRVIPKYKVLPRILNAMSRSSEEPPWSCSCLYSTMSCCR